MSHEDIKKRVYDATLNLYHVGLIRLSAGNISARIDDHLAAITPRSRLYDIMKAEDISIVSLDGKLVEGEFKPSLETPLHTAIYRELPEVGAVVHTHSIYAMTFAASEKPLPLLGVEALAARSKGAVPVARYVPQGLPMLARWPWKSSGQILDYRHCSCATTACLRLDRMLKPPGRRRIKSKLQPRLPIRRTPPGQTDRTNF